MANVVVIGGGGREHAICYFLKKSKKVDKIYCIPGNGGISQIAECIDIPVMDFDKIIAYLNTLKNIDLIVVAPDDPLVAGLVDELEKNGYRAFGPNKRAAILEGSKAFSKELMLKYNIPTAKYKEFLDYESFKNYINSQTKFPLVVKADGLALGKGVIIAQTKEEAFQAGLDMLVNYKFNKAGNKVIVEEFLEGKEVSILTFTDGKTIIPMVSSQDHKRAFDNDLGLNTGGMGTFSPSKCYTKDMEKYVYENIILKTVDALNKENRQFKGVIYFGLMLTSDGPKVLEYNARFGDPETQVVLPRLKTDLYEIFNACIDQTLDKVNIEWVDKEVVCVILASGGYPESYEKGFEIKIGDIDSDVMLFHAGDKMVDGKLVTAGGRVLGVTAMGDNIEEARKKAYKNVEKINFKNMQYRKDIGIKL